MIVFGILALLAALGVICWVLFNLAVFALPFFAGVTAGMAAFHSGAGPLGAVAVGIVAGVATLIVGQLALTLAPSMFVRVAVALLFAAPAAIAGYNATHGIVALTISSDCWRQAFSIVGAVIVGVTALARMMQPIVPAQPRVPFGNGSWPSKA